MARELDHVSYFKIECPFAADKLAALIEAAGDHIEGPFDGEEAATLLADLDAGATGTMTSAMFPERSGRSSSTTVPGASMPRSISGNDACR